MNKLNIVFEQLKQDGYSPVIVTKTFNDSDWSEINWVDESKDECSIYQDNISIENNRLTWFQSSKSDHHLLTVYENNDVFTWIPKTYNPIFGCYCLLLEWYKNHVIFIYQEKHGIYICSISNKNVKHFYFHGEEIERKGDLISYETYTNKQPNKIRLIKIPELTEPEPIDRTEAEKLGLVPDGLNRPGNFLAFK
jgi:hypothetical protein